MPYIAASIVRLACPAIWKHRSEIVTLRENIHCSLDRGVRFSPFI